MTFPSIAVFHQRGCPACVDFLPRFRRVTSAFRGRIAAHEIDINASRKAGQDADKLKIRATPTTVAFTRSGFAKVEGNVPESEIRGLVEAALRRK